MQLLAPPGLRYRLVAHLYVFGLQFLNADMQRTWWRMRHVLYTVTGTTGNSTAKTLGELTYYANDQLISERYRLDTWPVENPP